MTTPFVARILAPVAYVPKGGRTTRVGWFPVEASVRLGGLDGGAHASGGRATVSDGDREYDTLDQGGRSWIHSGAADDLARFLSGGREGVSSATATHMVMTPWSPLGHGEATQAGAPESVSRRIVWDGRERAVREAIRFAARDLAVHGGRAYVRRRGPLLVFPPPSGTGWPAFTERPRAGAWGDGYLCAPEREDTLRAIHPGAIPAGREPFGPMPPAPGSHPREDLRLMACALSMRIHERLDKALRRTELPEAGRPLARAAWEACAHWRLLGGLGAISHGETEAALRACGTAVEAFLAAHGSRTVDPNEAMQLAYVREVALPALAASATLHEEDAPSLSALAPR